MRFLSLEPLLEDLGTLDLRGIHWVIVGGESGKDARPMNIQWARNIRSQCTAAGVPFFFKQWGEHAPSTIGTYWHYPLAEGPQFQSRCPGKDTFSFCDDGYGAVRIGKKKAGRLLDGRTWDEMPKRRAVAHV